MHDKNNWLFIPYSKDWAIDSYIKKSSNTYKFKLSYSDDQNKCSKWEIISILQNSQNLTCPKHRTWGAGWRGEAHRWAPSGGCPPAWLSGWRNLASARGRLCDAVATAAPPGWRRAGRWRSCSELRAGTSCRLWKLSLLLGRVKAVVWDIKSMLPCLIYPSCPDPRPPHHHLHPGYFEAMISQLFLRV